MSKYKKAIIVVYIGKLLNYFDLWLESCKYNTSYTFFLFTDDRTPFDYPPNVKVFYFTFGDIQLLFKDKFDFDIVLDRPYKLCDYKVAYGDVFERYVNGFDFWGYCDLDDIFGDLDKMCQTIFLKNTIRYRKEATSLFTGTQKKLESHID